MFDTHYHFHFPQQVDLTEITERLDLIMVKQTEVAASLEAAVAGLEKVAGEVTALKQEVADLNTVIENMDEADPALIAAADKITARVASLDAMNTDLPPATPTEG